jgi:hypothetical protein
MVQPDMQETGDVKGVWRSMMQWILINSASFRLYRVSFPIGEVLWEISNKATFSHSIHQYFPSIG